MFNKRARVGTVAGYPTVTPQWQSVTGQHISDGPSAVINPFPSTFPSGGVLGGDANGELMSPGALHDDHLYASQISPVTHAFAVVLPTGAPEYVPKGTVVALMAPNDNDQVLRDHRRHGRAVHLMVPQNSTQYNYEASKWSTITLVAVMAESFTVKTGAKPTVITVALENTTELLISNTELQDFTKGTPVQPGRRIKLTSERNTNKAQVSVRPVGTSAPNMMACSRYATVLNVNGPLRHGDESQISVSVCLHPGMFCSYHTDTPAKPAAGSSAP